MKLLVAVLELLCLVMLLLAVTEDSDSLGVDVVVGHFPLLFQTGKSFQTRVDSHQAAVDTLAHGLDEEGHH